MSIVKVIEVIASSEKSIEDALQQAVTEASKTIRNIDSVYVKDIKAHVADGKISSYGLICKISFRLEEGNTGDTSNTSEEKAGNTAEEKKKEAPKQPASEQAPTSSEQPVIQGQPGKETERGQSKSAAGVKPKEGARKAGEKQSEENQQSDTSGKEPDDRVTNEEEVSQPENQKDFIPGH
ncbi:dodecin family protein [Filimonas effusa]|uniref:dodecin family protein n=1 Tax=Filimonas effusa TaxID=2508721 RepID=UPI001C706DB8|nr:dodecin family protein [Filimonas effusa]